MNMIHCKHSVIECAVAFITILWEDFPRHHNSHFFHELFPMFEYDITDRILKLFCVHDTYQLIIFVNFVFNLDSVFEIISFPNLFMGNSIKWIDIVWNCQDSEMMAK